MKISSIPALALSLSLLAGCVALPTNRTYYEPNPADGIPIRSSSCGWNATSLDALKRDLGGVVISVLPKWETGKPLSIDILLESATQSSLNATAERIALRVGGGASLIFPIETTAKPAGPYFFMAINVVFPPSLAAEDIAVNFLPGFLNLDGKELGVAPFRFKRTTKSDVYFASINC